MKTKLNLLFVKLFRQKYCFQLKLAKMYEVGEVCCKSDNYELVVIKREKFNWYTVISKKYLLFK